MGAAWHDAAPCGPHAVVRVDGPGAGIAPRPVSLRHPGGGARQVLRIRVWPRGLAGAASRGSRTAPSGERARSGEAGGRGGGVGEDVRPAASENDGLVREGRGPRSNNGGNTKNDGLRERCRGSQDARAQAGARPAVPVRRLRARLVRRATPMCSAVIHCNSLRRMRHGFVVGARMHAECVHTPVQEEDDPRPEGDQAVRGRTDQEGVLEWMGARVMYRAASRGGSNAFPTPSSASPHLDRSRNPPTDWYALQGRAGCAAAIPP
jgi:hypothetical protein